MKSAPAVSRTRRYSQSSRADAAEATGKRIVDAFIARLMAHWFDEVTLDGVAQDAGVTVQTVIRRFGGKEGLLGAAMKIVGEQIEERRAAPSRDTDRLVHNLIEDYEQTGDAVLRLLALESRQPVVRAVTDFGRGEHRRWVTAAFDPELKKLPPAARGRAIDMLIVVTDVYAWKLLRRDMNHGIAETEHTMKKMIRGVLAAI